jgi:iron complex transport system substrate-binding protein
VTRLAALALLAALPAGQAQAAPQRIYSLDQCADQYVLALAPRAAIVGLSHRADDADAYQQDVARGLPQGRSSFEAVFTSRPDVVVRYWGGDPRLMQALERRGVRTVTIEEANDFAGVRANLRTVAAALGAEARGRALEARMDAELQRSAGAWRGRRALYMTPGAFTAGSGTLVDAMLRAAGLRNAEEGPGFRPAPLERVVLAPPGAFVLGFFDTARFTRWQVARHPALERARADRTVASLPGKLLGCPAWFASEGVLRLAEAAPR